jgi:hypothetical protein
MAKAEVTRAKAKRRTAKAAARPHRTKLFGSCQCGKVTFSVESETPVPFMFCFCSICRKTSGSAFGSNIMGIRDTLVVKGQRSLRAYNARIREPGKPTRISEGKRWFCAACGTHVYITDERYPKGVWPNVSAVDTPLPRPERPVLMMTAFKPDWVPPWMTTHGTQYPRYPKLSIATWHEREGWPVTVRP